MARNQQTFITGAILLPAAHIHRVSPILYCQCHNFVKLDGGGPHRVIVLIPGLLTAYFNSHV